MKRYLLCLLLFLCMGSQGLGENLSVDQPLQNDSIQVNVDWFDGLQDKPFEFLEGQTQGIPNSIFVVCTLIWFAYFIRKSRPEIMILTLGISVYLILTYLLLP